MPDKIINEATLGIAPIITINAFTVDHIDASTDEERKKKCGMLQARIGKPQKIKSIIYGRDDLIERVTIGIIGTEVAITLRDVGIDYIIKYQSKPCSTVRLTADELANKYGR